MRVFLKSLKLPLLKVVSMYCFYSDKFLFSGGNLYFDSPMGKKTWILHEQKGASLLDMGLCLTKL